MRHAVAAASAARPAPPARPQLLLKLQPLDLPLLRLTAQFDLAAIELLLAGDQAGCLLLGLFLLRSGPLLDPLLLLHQALVLLGQLAAGLFHFFLLRLQIRR